MGVKKRDYVIKVELVGGKPEPVLKFDGKVMGPTEKLIFNKTTDNMKKVDHYRLRFTIEDFKNSKLRFIPDSTNVMWAQKGTSCPTSFCDMPSVFWVDDLDTKDGEWVEIINMDLTVEDFWFTLNLCDKSITNPTPADYVPLDPGGGNQNAGGSGSDYQSYVTVTTIAGAMAAMLAAALLGQELVVQNVLLYGLGGAVIGGIIGMIFDRR